MTAVRTGTERLLSWALFPLDRSGDHLPKDDIFILPEEGAVIWGENLLRVCHIDDGDPADLPSVSFQGRRYTVVLPSEPGYAYPDEFIIRLCVGALDWEWNLASVRPYEYLGCFTGRSGEELRAIVHDDELTALETFFCSQVCRYQPVMSMELIVTLTRLRTESMVATRGKISTIMLTERLLSPLPYTPLRCSLPAVNDMTWWYLYRTASVFTSVVATATQYKGYVEPQWLPVTSAAARSLYPTTCKGITEWTIRVGGTSEGVTEEYEFFVAELDGVADPVGNVPLTDAEYGVLTGMVGSLAFTRMVNRVGEDDHLLTDLTALNHYCPDTEFPGFVMDDSFIFSPLPVGFFETLEEQLADAGKLGRLAYDTMLGDGAFDSERFTPLSGRRLKRLRDGESLTLEEVFDADRPLTMEEVLDAGRPLSIVDEVSMLLFSDAREREYFVGEQMAEIRQVRLPYVLPGAGSFDPANDQVAAYLFNGWRQTVISVFRDYYADETLFSSVPLDWYLKLSLGVN